MIKFFKNLYEREIDYRIEIEFSIYDLLAGVLLLIFIVWMLTK